jgi:hypothetical protein
MSREFIACRLYGTSLMVELYKLYLNLLPKRLIKKIWLAGKQTLVVLVPNEEEEW